jgi:hypothetical protein
MAGSINIKIDAQFFQERKRQIAFFGAGLAATALIIFLYADAIRFLARSVDEALDIKQSSSQPVQFDIASLRRLGLLRPEHEALVPAPTAQPAGDKPQPGSQDLKPAAEEQQAATLPAPAQPDGSQPGPAASPAQEAAEGGKELLGF